MIKIAVTGGIGSGKSYISHLLENMHIPVYNADNEAKRLTVSDAGIRGELIALLGEEVYKDGLLNKPLLASYLFSDPAHVLQITAATCAAWNTATNVTRPCASFCKASRR